MQRRYLRQGFACLFLLLFLSSCGGSGSEKSTTTTGSSATSDANTVYDVSDISLDDTETGDDTSTSDAESVVTIVLADTGISINPEGSGASASGSVLTISQPGTYLISGSLTNGQIVVDCDDDGTIYLQLDGISIINQSGSPFFISSADEISIELMSGSSNYLEDTDEDNYTFEDGEDEPDAALFSKKNLTINGSGSLTVVGNFNEAIKSKDGLTISAATLDVTSVDDGIQGKDYLTINGADITINAAGDGLKSSNDKDETVGYVYLEDATLDITSGWIAVYSKGDGLDANGSIEMSGGTVLVHGPTSSNESAIDYDNNFYIDGGLLIATGPSSMSQAPGRASSQYSIKASFSTRNSGTLVHLQTTSGTTIASFTPDYSYSSVVISAPELSTGTSYTLYLGGNDSGTQTDGLYEGGNYSTGASFLSKTFSLSGMTTSISVP